VSHHTVFGDLRLSAIQVYRIHTQGSVYLLGIHKARGRKYVVVRGLPGTDREHVVVRDSDPRIGDTSLFEVDPQDWVGEVLEVATMTSSVITEVLSETNMASIAAVMGDGNASAGKSNGAGPGPVGPSADHASRSPWARPAGPDASERRAPERLVATPAGMQENPRIQVGLSRGTSPAAEAIGAPAGQSSRAASPVARQIVLGQAPSASTAAGEPGLPYPHRHIRYAEDCAALLRSIANRDRIFEDLTEQRELRVRLRRALEECGELLKKIRGRDRT
jgi:hypothetical protein